MRERLFMSEMKFRRNIGFGASPYSVKEGTLVTREQLDRVCPDKPVFMVKYDGHTCVVNTKLLEQALTVEEALKMCTYNGYYTTFDEKERGSLEKGKVADMVVLSENPFAVEKERLGEIKVERLLLQGRPYKKIGLNPFAQIIKGMVRKAGC